jgi:ATP-binding cassette subfamily C (CFTR/MRP) protein 1
MLRVPKLLSALLFLWVTPFIRRNTHSSLNESGLLQLPVADMVSRDTLAIERALEASAGKGALPLALDILLIYRRTFLALFGLSLVLLICTCLNPLLLRELLRALTSRTEAIPHSGLLPPLFEASGVMSAPGRALLSCLLLFVSTVVSILSGHHIWYRQVTLATRIKLALSQLVYRKSLVLDRAERSSASSGFIINLLANDAQKIWIFLSLTHTTWTHPLLIGAVMVILYLLVGPAALWGASTLVLILLVSICISRVQSRIRRRLSSTTDGRISLMNETLQHIKAVKFQAWESRLIERIAGIRAREVSDASILVRLSALSSFTATSAPALAMLVTFSAVVVSDDPLTLDVIFPTLSLLLTLRFALSALPETMFNAIDAWVGFSRLRGFLYRKEWHRLVNSSAPSGSIEIAQAAFEWESEKQALYIAELTVRQGEFIAVVGGVGSGKSAFLLGLLGELTMQRGTVQVGGSTAYVPQQAWILSDTIRNNILCGAAFDEARYAQALLASCLEVDLASFPAHDLTEIGERGVNLSGGQRQRLALARAFYQSADVYLLDDPLSALDPAVANSVFEELLTKKLSDKTRILVTHRLEYALRAERVLVVEGGRIIEDGSPDDLKGTSSRFGQLLSFHARSTGNTSAIETSHDITSIDEGKLDKASPSTSYERTIVEEEREQGSISKDVVRSYVRRLVPGWALALLLTIFVMRHVAAVSVDLWVSSYSARPVLTVSAFLGGYFALVLLLCSLNLLRSLYLFSRGLAASIDAHTELLKGVLRAPLRFFESNPIGRILNRFSRDLDTIEQLLPRAVLDTLHCTLEVLALLVVILLLEPLMLVVLSPVFAYYYRTQKAFRPTSREVQRLESTTRSPVLALLAESLTGIDTIRASTLASSFDARFSRLLETNGRAAYSLLCANRWLGIRLEMVGAFIMLVGGLSSIFLSQHLVFTAAIGLMLTYALNIAGAIHWLVRSVASVESNLTSFERLERYAKVPSERLDGADPPTGWPRSGRLAFENLSLRYRADLPPALSQLSCSIEDGQRIGIIGRTGSGKSTLVLGLMRLLEPSEGTILLDSIDITSIKLERLRGAITVIPQEPVLFTGTLRENIDPFGQHQDDQIQRALARVHLSRLVNSLPHGLDSSVHEGGTNLSSGQRQLLCLARALLENTRIIVMDEATAHIDAETDYAIQHALRREFQTTTVLIIAHRLGTILDSDRILVLQDGSLREFGDPLELLRQPNSALRVLVNELNRPTNGEAT